MKKTIFIYLFLTIQINLVLGQNFGEHEIVIANYTNSHIWVKLYPVSTIFNGKPNYDYTIVGLNQSTSSQYPEERWNYINGANHLGLTNGQWTIVSPNGTQGYNFDSGDSPGFAHSIGNYGHGVYKIIVSYADPSFKLLNYDTVLVDNDLWNDIGPGDLGIYIYENPHRFEYCFCNPSGQHHDIYSLPEQKINVWEHGQTVRRRNYGNFELLNDPNSIYNYDFFPLDTRIYCNVEFNGNFPINQNQYYPSVELNEINYYLNDDDRQGNLKLNLTIKKNVHSPEILYDTAYPFANIQYVAKPSNIVIFDSVFLAIDKGTTSPIVLTLDKFLSPPGINDGTDIIVKNAAKLILKHSDVYSTHAELKVRTYCNVLVHPFGTLKIEKYGNVVLEAGGTMKLDKHSIVDAETPALITLNNGGTLINCGANFINNSVCKVANNGGSYTIGGTACPEKVIQTINDSSFIVLDGGNLIIGDSSKLIFDGPTSYLNIKSGSEIKLGNGASIVFKNGAYLRANGATFSQTSSGKISDGLVFENSGLDSIVNCTFSNAKTSITIKNDSVSLANSNNNIITGNTFYVSQANGRAIDARNVFNLLFQNNTIGVSGGGKSFGMYFRNTIDGSSYSLNIVKNVFAGAAIPLYLSCLAANKTPVYVAKNEFYGSNSYSLVCQKISGDIKKNVFSIYNGGSAIGLWNCNANIFGNTIHSISLNMYLNYSYPVLSPTSDDFNHTIWMGGRNDFYADENENILMTNSLPSLNMGINLFTINANYPDHILGSIPDTNMFLMKNNCWLNPYDSAKFNVFKYQGDFIKQIPAIYLPQLCEDYLTCQSPAVVNKGNGIYDTIQITQDILEIVMDDEMLVFQARSDFRRHAYPDAITNYKGLINNYPSSSYLFTSLSELYDSYDQLDTSGNENTTDVLFGDLKGFLEDKILSDVYDTTFEEAAFESVLMCETKMDNFEAALTGYEFMALYHPDAEQRMLASWDYEDINNLLGEGEGGGKSIKNYELGITNEEQERLEALYELREFKRLNKKINDDPILKRMKKRYEKAMSTNKQRQDKAITTNTLNNKLDGRARQEQSEKLISRAKDNIMRSKYLSKEEKEVRRLDDMRILFGESKTELQTDNINTSLPGKYTLSQNYPNPFNPTTTISYQLPKAGLVSITVYDITGKEVTKLVNEFKDAGSYDITFTASNLSSGIYFYSLKTDGFTDTKKMVVIK